MKYDFTAILERSGHDAMAVDDIPTYGAAVKEGFSIIPMWVADMNFPVFPGITEAIQERLSHPHFGYFLPTKEYYESIMKWHRDRYQNQELTEESIGYENGVMGCTVSAIHTFTEPGEAVLLHSPTYIGFMEVLKNTGRKAVLSDLVRDEQGIWRMDYQDMEQKIKENRIHFVIFCSPHNPSGRVWEREEIERALEVFKKCNCVVLSDEIWADIVMPGYHHIPTQTVSEDAKQRTIAMYAPTKTFSLAGLVGAYHVIYNDYLRDRMEYTAESTHYNAMNVLSFHSLLGAYQEEGRRWVDELCQVLDRNIEYVYRFFTDEVEGITLARPQGTYMLYLDCSRWCRDHAVSLEELLKAGIEVGVIWQDGRPFQRPDTIRINVALPFVKIEEAVARLKTYVFCER
ncbi:MAG: MalY/PatB family protein [Lachnospiraceae bacterium]|jgi:cystathionine beta-lyase